MNKKTRNLLIVLVVLCLAAFIIGKLVLPAVSGGSKSITVNVGGQNYKVEIAYGNDVPAATQTPIAAAAALPAVFSLSVAVSLFLLLSPVSPNPFFTASFSTSSGIAL